jgi:hypothetical protein
MHHRTIQINHQPDATISQFIILTFIYSSTCFGRCPAHHKELNDCSGSLWFYLRIVVTVVLCSWSGSPAGTTSTSAFPEAATAVWKFSWWWAKYCPKHVEQLNDCGFHIVVLILLYDKGMSIQSNTTMFDFIFAFYSSDMFRPFIWLSSGFRLYYTTVHILITTAYGYTLLLI